MAIPERYKDIRAYIEGLQFAGLLEGDKSKLTFLNSEKFWCSHIILFAERGYSFDVNYNKIPKVESDLFGVYYLKSKDRVWIKSSIPARSRSMLRMMNNSFIDELKRKGKYQARIDEPQSFFSGKAYVKVLIEPHHTEDNIYELFQFFRKYQTNEELLKDFY